MPAECRIDVRVQEGDFDVVEEIQRLSQDNETFGAIVTFTGICRDEDGRLAALELEHYPGMAESEILRIAKDAAGRWPVGAISVIHRYGKIRPGGNIVLVVAASKHRRAAFETASFLMDFLKTRAPFWKKEHLADGTTGEWVQPSDSDEEATGNWSV